MAAKKKVEKRGPKSKLKSGKIWSIWLGDDARKKVEKFMRKNKVSRSEAVRQMLDSVKVG